MEEISAPHGMKKKEMLIVAGAVASIIAIFVLLKNRASTAGQVVSPSRAPLSGSGGSQDLQALTAAAQLQLGQQKLAQDAQFQQAQLALSAKALDTQYAIAAKQADAQTARTAIGAGAASLAPGGAGSDLIKGLMNLLNSPKTTPQNAAPQGFGGLDATPGSSLWNRLSEYFTAIGASNENFAKIVGNDNNPLTIDSPYDPVTISHDNSNLENVWSNTLSYDTGQNWGSDVFYGSDLAGTNDQGIPSNTYDPTSGEGA